MLALRIYINTEQNKETSAAIKFLACEPLLGPLNNMDLFGIDWVIVCGESVRKPRVMQKEWAVDIKNQCDEQSIPFFFKQWGGTNKKKNGRLLDGKLYNEMPRLKNLVTN